MVPTLEHASHALGEPGLGEAPSSPPAPTPRTEVRLSGAQAGQGLRAAPAPSCTRPPRSSSAQYCFGRLQAIGHFLSSYAQAHRLLTSWRPSQASPGPSWPLPSGPPAGSGSHVPSSTLANSSGDSVVGEACPRDLGLIQAGT